MGTTPSGMPASGGALIAELSRRARLEGGNTGVWPGLTIYRFTSPTGPTVCRRNAFRISVTAMTDSATAAQRSH